jgi:RHS repeat-associated protein
MRNRRDLRPLLWATLFLSASVGAQTNLPAQDPTSDAVGTVAGTFRVDESGQASYRIPIAVTPGVAGLVPDLALAYSSQGSDSPVGLGWSISGSSQISRCRKSREQGDALSDGNYFGPAVRFTSEDVFCLDGQRLLVVVGSYGAPDSEYRPEQDPFTRITALGGSNSADPATYTGPSSFRVERRDGTVQTYGASDNARLSILNCGGGTGRACAHRQWLLTRVEDSSGNYLDYVYARWLAGAAVGATAAADEIHLSEVLYTGKRRLSGQSAPDAAPYARVVFNYVTRAISKQYAGWQGGEPYRLSRELSGVGVFEPMNTEVRHYALQHQDAPSGSGKRLLHRVKECTNADQTLCYPATEFSPAAGSAIPNQPSEVELANNIYGQMSFFRVGDLDGDGRHDIVWAGPHAGCATNYGVRALFSSHTGSGASARTQLLSLSSQVMCLQRSDQQSADEWHLLDINGDGRDDLLMAGAAGGQWTARASLGRPASQFDNVFGSSELLNVQVPVGSGTTGAAELQLLDVNGDGLSDLLYPSQSQSTPGLSGSLTMRLGQIDRSGATPQRAFSGAYPVQFNLQPTDLCSPSAPGAANTLCAVTFVRGGNQVRPVDLDGDGRSDLQLQVTRYALFEPWAQSPRLVFATEQEQQAWVRESAARGIGPVPQEISWYFFTATGPLNGTAVFEQYDRIAPGPDGVSPQLVYQALADVNGDGLMDFAFAAEPNQTEAKVRLNTGRGFAPAVLAANGIRNAARLQWLDVTGDGRADLVHPVDPSGAGTQCGGQTDSSGAQAWCLYPSVAGTTSSPYLMDGARLMPELRASSSGRSIADFESLMLDIDGDGQLDFLRLARNVFGNATEARMVRTTTPHVARDAIVSIVDGFGAETRIQYQPLTNRGVYRPGKEGWKLEKGRGSPVFDLLAPMYVVSAVESASPVRGSAAARARTDYRYSAARMQSGGRGFLGFAAIDAFDANDVSTAGLHGASRTKYAQEFPFIGAPASSQKAVGFGTPVIASGVTESCRQHPENASTCFEPSSVEWLASEIGLRPGESGGGPRLHSSTINVYQTLEFGVPGACNTGTSSFATDLVEQMVRAGEMVAPWQRRAAAGAQTALAPMMLGTWEEGYTATSSILDHTQLSLSFSLFCYEDGYGNLTRGFTDVRNPEDFGARLHFTETQSSFDNGSPLSSTQPWRLGRLLTSTVTKTLKPNTPSALSSVRKAHFSYDLASQAKTGQLLSERIEVAGQSTTRTLYTLDDYGNRTAAFVCSEHEWDGSTLTDAECKDSSRVRMRPTSSDGLPTTAVHRYTRTEFDTRGRYPVRSYAPFFSPGATNERVERITEEVVSRNVFGQVTHSRDVNGRNAYARFGALGRPYATELQGGALGVTTFRLCGGATSCPPEAVYRQRTTLSDGPTQWSYHDRLGQVVLAATQSFEASNPDRNFSAVCTFRDTKARPAETSVPFFLPSQSGSEPSFSGTAADPCNLATNRYEQKSYDLLSRPTQVIAPDGSGVGFAYSGMTTVQTNALGQKTWETRNVLGQVVSEVQANPDAPASQGMAVTHEYDAEGQLRYTRRDAGAGEIVSERHYDVFGRLSQSIDPDRKTEHFQYNAAGELIRKTDSGNVATLMHYDAQGRLWKRESGTPVPPPTPPAAQIFESGFESSTTQGRQIDVWQFDTAANGLGQVDYEERVTPQEATFRRVFSYDSLGRPQHVDTLIEGQTRRESTAYDSVGRVWTSTDATGASVEQVYTARGFVEQLRNAANIGQIYNRVIEVNARGQVTRERRGDSAAMEISRVYDAQRGWLTAIDSGTGQSLQKLRYQFDTLGRLQWRHDQRLSQREDFTYDGLNRLRTATVTLSGFSPLQTMNLSYDLLGNICTKNSVAYTYAGRSGCVGSQGLATASPHAVSTVGGRMVRYDAQGRMSYKAGASSSTDRYTDFNGLDQMVVALTGTPFTPAAEMQLNYTPGGARYLLRERISGALTTTRIYGSVEEVRRPDGTVLTRRYVGGVAIENRTGSAFNTGTPELRYLFTDHLGSLDVIADGSGVAVERLSFDPHGRRRQVSDWRSTLLPTPPTTTPRGFTGHEHLDDYGLVHMNGRVYDSELGRFIQPDPMLDSGIQGLNRYTYVLNNPLSLTDPSGYSSVGDFLRTVVAIAITVYTGGWAAGYWGTALTTTQAFGVVVAGGFAAGAIQAGSLKGGVQGAFTAAVFFGIGSYFESAKWAQHATKANTLNTVGRTAKIVAHGVTGGVLSDVQGGKFAHGFASAGFSEAAGPLTQGIDSQLGQGVAHALIGGTASKLSGGKFSNGAVTAAMGFAFNSLIHRNGFEGEAGMNAEEYLKAVEEGLWKDAPTIDGYSNNKEVAAAGSRANSGVASSNDDVSADPRYAEFLRRVGPATARARLHSSIKGGQGEKFLALAINSNGEVVVLRVAVLVGQGATVGSLAVGAGAIAHVHYEGLIQPPHQADHSAVKYGRISSFVLGHTGRRLWEVGRMSGGYVYRDVSRSSPRGWQEYPGN